MTLTLDRTDIAQMIKDGMEVAGFNQSGLAHAMSEAGVPTDQMTISRTLRGERSLTLIEALVMRDLISLPILETAGVDASELARLRAFRARVMRAIS